MPRPPVRVGRSAVRAGRRDPAPLLCMDDGRIQESLKNQESSVKTQVSRLKKTQDSIAQTRDRLDRSRGYQRQHLRPASSAASKRKSSGVPIDFTG
ncbi:hypothetical protein E4U37_004802 [Claviceps purpurea]|nr:hypothetical protein E4U37_004802 [Claviceps purpurea]